MRSLRSPFVTVFCLVILISLLSGLAVSAAPQRASETSSAPVLLGCKKAASATLDRSEKPITVPSVGCCIGKIGLPSSDEKSVNPLLEPIDPCCYTKPALGVRGKYIPPCEPIPTPEPTCPIAYTDGAVVGDLPFDTQAYWAPGKPALKVILNKGTYWVFGTAAAENGDEYYQILVSCQKLFVPVSAMQPSFVPPWSGEPLPTTPVA